MSRRRFVLSITWLLTAALVAATPVAAGADREPVAGFDDWPVDSWIDFGTLSCPGGEPVFDGPVPSCPEGTRIHIRNAVTWSCIHAMTGTGAPEPRLTGVMQISLNANLGPDYTGRVWGRWEIVLSETCDHSILDGDGPHWEGAWNGRRSRICEGEACLWLGVLDMVGRGTSGIVDGLRFKGTEITTTFSPVPVPNELIPGFCLPPDCPPEGTFSGEILTPGKSTESAAPWTQRRDTSR